MTDNGADLMTERAVALGLVVEWSAMMEHTLRDAFCSLVGSKFAATVAGGQTAGWLIESCKKLTDAHREMPVEARQAIKDALSACAVANDRRNTLVHGVKTASNASDGRLQTIRSRRGTHVPAVESWMPADIREAGGALLQADLRLFAAIQAAVSPHVMVIGDALGWEDVRERPASNEAPSR
jgi:hypothetical protein